MRARTGMSTAMAAPNAAPDAAPSTYGSASGFRRRPWNAAPATARPPPTTIAVRTRGSRRALATRSVQGLGVERQDEGPQPVGQARPRSGDQDVLGDREDVPVLHRGDVAPAGPGGDIVDRRVVGVVTEQDHLRVGGDELLERDLVAVVGRDRVGGG